MRHINPYKKGFVWVLVTVLHTSPGHTVLKGNATPLLFKIQRLIKGLYKPYFLFDNALQKRPCLGEGEKK